MSLVDVIVIDVAGICTGSVIALMACGWLWRNWRDDD